MMIGFFPLVCTLMQATGESFLFQTPFSSARISYWSSRAFKLAMKVTLQQTLTGRV